MNHTSYEHPWFQEALSYIKSLPKDATIEDFDESICPYIRYYNFSDKQRDGYTRIEGTSFYYESQFWAGMPDVNLDCESVKNEYKDVARYWLNKGVDGFRLDAVAYYYNDDEKNIETLRWFNNYVKSLNEEAYIVGEVWRDQNTYAPYYESGIDSIFDFKFAKEDGLIAKTLRGEVSISLFARELEEEEKKYKSYNDKYINAPFYTNHDTDRSTSYYYGEKALDCIKMAGGMNLITSGNAFIYYGEELGMEGFGIDDNKRAPMQWGEEKGKCVGPPNMDYINMKYGSYEGQKDGSDSIYNYYKKAIHIRNKYPVIARGKTSSVNQDDVDEKICVIKKSSSEPDDYDDIYIIINDGKYGDNIDISMLGSVEVGDVLSTRDLGKEEYKIK